MGGYCVQCLGPSFFVCLCFSPCVFKCLLFLLGICFPFYIFVVWCVGGPLWSLYQELSRFLVFCHTRSFLYILFAIPKKNKIVHVSSG